MKRFFFALLLLLSGCDSSKLSNIEDAAKGLFFCKAHQIFQSDCLAESSLLKLAQLKATQAGIDVDRVYASQRIGEKAVLQDSKDSPYERVKRSLQRKPFYIKPVNENFKPYKVACTEFKSESVSLVKSEKTQFRTIAYYLSDNVLNVLYVRTAPPCRPSNYKYINDEFPIITETQLIELKNRVNTDKGFYPGYELINTMIFETEEEARKKFESQK